MNIGTTLAQLKTKSLTEIEEAARRADASSVLEGGHRLQVIESLSSQLADLESAVGALLESNGLAADIFSAGSLGRVSPTKRSESGQDGMSHKVYGKQKRRDFVDKLNASGITLKHVHGLIYQAPSGARVGLAFATEQRPDRWFLGLQEGVFDQALLLCEAQGGQMTALSLGKDFFAKYGRQLSSSNGQVKFNVVRNGSSFGVQVPGLSRVNLDACRNNYTNLL